MLLATRWMGGPALMLPDLQSDPTDCVKGGGKGLVE